MKTKKEIKKEIKDKNKVNLSSYYNSIGMKPNKYTKHDYEAYANYHMKPLETEKLEALSYLARAFLIRSNNQLLSCVKNPIKLAQEIHSISQLSKSYEKLFAGYGSPIRSASFRKEFNLLRKTYSDKDPNI